MRLPLLFVLALASCVTVRPPIDPSVTAGLDFERCLVHQVNLAEATCDYEARQKYDRAWRATDVHFGFTRTGRLETLDFASRLPFAGAAEWNDCFRRQLTDLDCKAAAVGDFDRVWHLEKRWAPFRAKGLTNI